VQVQVQVQSAWFGRCVEGPTGSFRKLDPRLVASGEVKLLIYLPRYLGTCVALGVRVIHSDRRLERLMGGSGRRGRRRVTTGDRRAQEGGSTKGYIRKRMYSVATYVNRPIVSTSSALTSNNSHTGCSV